MAIIAAQKIAIRIKKIFSVIPKLNPVEGRFRENWENQK